MFSLRQLVEKRLEKQGNMVLGFVDLDRVRQIGPRKMAFITQRWVETSVLSRSNDGGSNV